MPVTSKHVNLVRAQLAGDAEGFRDIGTQLTDAEVQDYESLLQAVLSIAARRRFASGYSDSGIIRYVARLRAGPDGRDEDIALDPLSTERMLKFALGQSGNYVTEPRTRLRSTMALVSTLTAELKIPGNDIDALLAEAAQLANRWLVQASAPSVADTIRLWGLTLPGRSLMSR